MDQSSFTERDAFEAWLASMDEFLERFGKLIHGLDYSLESLDTVEAWVVEKFTDPDAMLDSSSSAVVNDVGCYIGEVIRKHGDGQWDIILDDPNNAYFGLPVLRMTNAVECPMTLATASADRRSGNYIRGVVEYLVENCGG